jgi:hypothetical protein
MQAPFDTLSTDTLILVLCHTDFRSDGMKKWAVKTGKASDNSLKTRHLTATI